MSFWIYEVMGDHACRVAPLKLTGAGGLLAAFLADYKAEDTPYAWQLTWRDLLALHNPELDVQRHLVAIDLMPESFTKVCLYRLMRIQGSSDVDESDVVLAFKVLYEEPVNEPADSVRKKVPLLGHDHERQMLEALRLTGGTVSGNYYWAKPKMDIGAAVCPAGAMV